MRVNMGDVFCVMCVAIIHRKKMHRCTNDSPHGDPHLQVYNKNMIQPAAVPLFVSFRVRLKTWPCHVSFCHFRYRHPLRPRYSTFSSRHDVLGCNVSSRLPSRNMTHSTAGRVFRFRRAPNCPPQRWLFNYFSMCPCDTFFSRGLGFVPTL